MDSKNGTLAALAAGSSKTSVKTKGGSKSGRGKAKAETETVQVPEVEVATEQVEVPSESLVGGAERPDNWVETAQDDDGEDKSGEIVQNDDGTAELASADAIEVVEDIDEAGDDDEVLVEDDLGDDEETELQGVQTIMLPFPKCMACLHLCPTLPEETVYRGKSIPKKQFPKGVLPQEFACFTDPRCPATKIQFYFDPIKEERVVEAFQSWASNGNLDELNKLYAEADEIGQQCYDRLHIQVQGLMANMKLVD